MSRKRELCSSIIPLNRALSRVVLFLVVSVGVTSATFAVEDHSPAHLAIMDSAVGDVASLQAELARNDDMEFLLFGNNNGANNWTEAGAPVGYNVLSRQWSVQEAGDVGTVQLDVDVADAEQALGTTTVLINLVNEPLTL